MAEFSFEIVNHYGKLSTSGSGWSKELTEVSWNGRPAKYDIREWDPDYQRMGKGLTFTAEELKALRDCLNKMEL